MFEILAQTTQPVITGLDVVNEVKSFFEVGWGMLLVTGGVLGVVVGWLVPWWVSRTQKVAFELEKTGLLQRIEEARLGSLSEISLAKDELKTAMSNIKEELSHELDLAIARTFSSMAMASKGRGRLVDAGYGVHLELQAVERYARAGNQERTEALLRRAQNSLESLLEEGSPKNLASDILLLSIGKTRDALEAHEMLTAKSLESLDGMKDLLEAHRNETADDADESGDVGPTR